MLQLLQIVGRFASDVASKFQLDIYPDLQCKLYYYSFCIPESTVSEINFKLTTLSEILHWIESLMICSGAKTKCCKYRCLYSKLYFCACSGLCVEAAKLVVAVSGKLLIKQELILSVCSSCNAVFYHNCLTPKPLLE